MLFWAYRYITTAPKDAKVQGEKENCGGEWDGVNLECHYVVLGWPEPTSTGEQMHSSLGCRAELDSKR